MGLYERMGPPKWKPVRNFPGYEISEEGQIRTNLSLYRGDNAQAWAGFHNKDGELKARFWRYSNNRPNARSYVPEHEWEHAVTHGTLMVRLYRDGKKKDIPVAKLLSSHWPNATVPEYWTANDSTSPPPGMPDRRKKLSYEERVQILKSDGTMSSIGKEYRVSKSSVARILHGKDCTIKRHLREHPEDKKYLRSA